eukprot:7183184-Pyramimonas_sp.AAC.1
MSWRRRAGASVSSASSAWSRAAGAWSGRAPCGSGRVARPQRGTRRWLATPRCGRPSRGP